MGRRTTYKKKYAKQLINGLRDNASMSIAAVCKKWGIVRSTYYRWVKQFPEFREAHEIGEQDYHIQIEQLMLHNATGHFKGNAGVLNLMAKNMLGWKDKVEVESTGDNPVQKIEIEILQNKALEHKEEDYNILDVDVQDAAWEEISEEYDDD